MTALPTRIDPPVIWTDGDAWRPLTEEALDAGKVTVISLNGSARLLDLRPGHLRHRRVPLEGGHTMAGDGDWRPLRTFQLSPCGFTLTMPEGRWAAGTPVRLVIAGLHPHWTTTAVGAATVDRILARTYDASPGHPDQPCGAAYCPARQR